MVGLSIFFDGINGFQDNFKDDFDDYCLVI